MKLRLITWNVARRNCTSQQFENLRRLQPDVIALQEVTPAVLERAIAELPAVKLDHYAHSLIDDFGDAKNRRYGVMIASRFPLCVCEQPKIPWPEKALSIIVQTPQTEILLTNAYIPPGSSNGEIKINTIEGVVNYQLNTASTNKVLCGDFNCPQFELADGTIVTWGQKLTSPDGATVDDVCHLLRWELWDKVERSLFLELSGHGLKDVFRTIHGFDRLASSWHLKRNGRDIPRRYDHVFSNLQAVECEYDHQPRLDCLSDHAIMYVDFEL